MPSFRAEADALLAMLSDIRKDILNLKMRCAFLSRLRARSEAMLIEMRSRPDTDPHKALANMLLTAAYGTGEDEFTTPKLDALQAALVVLGASAIGPSDLERVRRCSGRACSAGASRAGEGRLWTGSTDETRDVRDARDVLCNWFKGT